MQDLHAYETLGEGKRYLCTRILFSRNSGRIMDKHSYLSNADGAALEGLAAEQEGSPGGPEHVARVVVLAFVGFEGEEQPPARERVADGVEEATAWAAVLLFRLINYWFPTIPGYVALRISERRVVSVRDWFGLGP